MNLLQMQLLLAHEPWVYTKGWIVTVVGFCIVILALYILSSIFRGVAAYFTRQDAKKAAGVKEVKVEVKPAAVKAAKGDIPAEVLTAIGMALYLSTNLHDEESNVITIERRNTSWNDKNYGVRHWNR